jgi:hypothetical protein
LLEPREGLPPLIVTPAELADATAELSEGTGPVAVDAERASGFRYGHRAFLVQLRRNGAGTVLIDPIACPDLSELDDALAGTEAVLHAANQDLPCLADLGFRPRRLFDTELAGRLLGYPRVGLGTLVEEVLGLTLEKTHSAADWSTRPLPQEWLKYAALDGEVLIELRMRSRKNSMNTASQLGGTGVCGGARGGRTAAARPLAPHLRNPPVRSRRSLVIVRELWLERDQIAGAHDSRRQGSSGRGLSSRLPGRCRAASPSSLRCPVSQAGAHAGTGLTGCAPSGGANLWPTRPCPTHRPRQATGRRLRTGGRSATPWRPGGSPRPAPRWRRSPTPITCLPRTWSLPTPCAGCPGSRPTRSARKP